MKSSDATMPKRTKSDATPLTSYTRTMQASQSSLIPGPRHTTNDGQVIKLALFDVDNTLIANESSDLPSPAFRQAAADAAHNGIAIGLVSARPLSKTRYILDSINASGLSILCNGAQIIDSASQEVIEEWPLNLSTCMYVIQYLSKQGVYYWINDDGVDYFPIITNDSASDDGFERLSNIWDRSSPRIAAPDYQPAKPFVINLHGITAAQAQEASVFINGYGDTDTTTLISHETKQSDGSLLYDLFVVHRLANKKDALHELARLQGLSVQTILAVGDGRNDAVLVGGAGVGVAMANAAQETLAVATYIAPRYDEDGATVALRYFGS